MLVNWGLAGTHFQVSVGHFFLGNIVAHFNLGHMPYLFNMWTKQELQNLTIMQVINERFLKGQKIKSYVYFLSFFGIPGLAISAVLFIDCTLE